MAKEKSVAERAVRGVLGGWVFGEVEIAQCDLYNVPNGATGKPGAFGWVRVFVPKASVDEMLRRERLTKKGAKKNKEKKR